MLGNALFREWATQDLVWLADAGVGYYPVRFSPKTYDERYFKKYQAYAETDLGQKLTAARVALVRRHWRGPLVDIGIGCGQFVEASACMGYDINPAGVAWLRKRGCYCNPYEQRIAAATFWDSFEHIADPAELLGNVTTFAFIALPIFTDLAHVLRSKHHRRTEHYLYFTRWGLDRYMRRLGWRCVEHNRVESDLGREDIDSFAFARCS